MSTDTVATVTPRPEAEDCEGDDCEASEGLATVDPDDPDRDARTLCGNCRLAYFEELRA